jgi:hypothetical protein
MDRLFVTGAAAIAALCLSASPAAAQFGAAPGVSASPGASVTVHRGTDPGHDGRKRRSSGPVVVVGGPFGGNEGWALYNNRTWEPDSFNDWWHDRPDRAYPRWVQNNQNCDRMWWGGGVWRCSW